MTETGLAVVAIVCVIVLIKMVFYFALGNTFGEFIGCAVVMIALAGILLLLVKFLGPAFLVMAQHITTEQFFIGAFILIVIVAVVIYKIFS